MLAVHETSYQQSLRSLKKKISTLHNSTMAVFKIGKKINGKSGRSFWCSVPVAGHGLWRSCRGGWHTGAPSVPGVCSRWPQGLSWCITFLRSSRWIKIISDRNVLPCSILPQTGSPRSRPQTGQGIWHRTRGPLPVQVRLWADWSSDPSVSGVSEVERSAAHVQTWVSGGQSQFCFKVLCFCFF